MPLTRTQVRNCMLRHGIPGEVHGRGTDWEAHLPDAQAYLDFIHYVASGYGGYRTAAGGYVIGPEFDSLAAWNDRTAARR
jgi:hypothetical protein